MIFTEESSFVVISMFSLLSRMLSYAASAAGVPSPVFSAGVLSVFSSAPVPVLSESPETVSSLLS